MPHPTVESTPASLPIAEPWQRPALTPRGVAAAHLSRFQDAWDDLSPADRAWFAHWLTELLVEAAVPDLPPAR